MHSGLFELILHCQYVLPLNHRLYNIKLHHSINQSLLVSSHLNYICIYKEYDIFDNFIICSCYFDGVKGTMANLFFTTVPLVLIVVLNSILYILTWIRIHKETKRLHLGDSSQLLAANFTAARNMSLFVVAFFIQWWAMSMFGVWAYINPDSVPQLVFHLVTTFSNIGGILNLIVYIIIRRRLILRKKMKKKKAATEMSTLASSKSFSL